MTDGVQAALRGCELLHEDEERWLFDGPPPGMPLRVRLYRALRPPPDALTSAVRTLVTNAAGEVLVLRHRERGVHVLPGGRREEDEPLLMALRRELLEETGYHIEAPRLTAILHYQHLAPRPAGFAWRYPDFLQVIYTAQAGVYDSARMSVRDDESVLGFRPLEGALLLVTQGRSRALLRALMRG